MNVKQVIVLRKDLNMRKGKMVAQGAHASMKVFFDRFHSSTRIYNPPYHPTEPGKLLLALISLLKWLRGWTATMPRSV